MEHPNESVVEYPERAVTWGEIERAYVVFEDATNHVWRLGADGARMAFHTYSPEQPFVLPRVLFPALRAAQLALVQHAPYAPQTAFCVGRGIGVRRGRGPDWIQVGAWNPYSQELVKGTISSLYLDDFQKVIEEVDRRFPRQSRQSTD